MRGAAYLLELLLHERLQTKRMHGADGHEGLIGDVPSLETCAGRGGETSEERASTATVTA
jgi:hypothetical protein